MEARGELAGGAGVDSDVGCGGRGSGAGSATWSARRTQAAERQARPRWPLKHSPGFLKLVEDAKARVREVSVDDARQKLEAGKAKVIDVREDNEWAAGHARGAEHMGRGVIERDIEARFPDKNSELILYCGGGFRSALATDNVQKMGYRNVWSMAGGWRAWQAAGAPIDAGDDT
jgi:rhodanese-related sulfurtransferase